MFNLRFRGAYDSPIASELDAVNVQVNGWSSVEHDDDGSHTAITADSIDVDGSVTVGGSVDVGDTITADAIGSNATGTALVVNNGFRFLSGPWVLENDGNNVAYAAVQAPQITGNQNNYHPTSLETAIVLELSSDAARTITGLYATRQRRLLYLVNRGSYTITLSHVSGSSTSAYQFAFSNLEDYELRSGGMVCLYYDAGSELWRAEAPVVPVVPATMVIKSIQYGTITFTNGGANNPTATLSPAVDIDNTVLQYLGASADSSGFTARVTLEDGTTVRANRDGAHATVSAVVSFCVVEWELS